MHPQMGIGSSIYRPAAREEYKVPGSRCKKILKDIALQGACLAAVLGVFGIVSAIHF